MNVRGEDPEQVGRPAQWEVLREIARITHGDFGHGTNLPAFLARIETLPARETTEHRLRLWSHPLWGAWLLGLLTIYWIGRKMVGLL
jgi:hypothetical protein